MKSPLYLLPDEGTEVANQGYSTNPNVHHIWQLVECMTCIWYNILYIWMLMLWLSNMHVTEKS